MLLRAFSRTARRSMSSLAFSDAKFDSSSYSDYRPTYGKPLFDQLLSYHKSDNKLAVDIGCGTGQVTTVLARHFQNVLGFDTSETMLNKATKLDNVKYEIGIAEKLPLDNESVSLVTVGQAAHWFDHASWFKEMARILQPNGTLSFWSYNEAEFTDSKAASKIWNTYSHDTDKLGPHWQQPGRRILESAMAGVDPPTSLFKDIERHYTAQLGSTDPSPVAKSMPLSSAESYFRTASSFHHWQASHPHKQSLKSGGKSGDLIDRMMGEIKKVTGWRDDTIVQVHWPTVAVLARKK